MKVPGSKKLKPGGKSIISKEFFVGLLIIALGGYNLLATINFIPGGPANTTEFQLVTNILLVVAGLLLWLTAFKLGRYKYHTKHLF